MELNKSQPMTETVSLRLTSAERVVLEQLAAREERTISNYVRKHLRSHLEQRKGTER
jgi:predicted DNA-binding protein